MINIRAITNLMKGALGPDELAELLASLGIEIEMREVSGAGCEQPFRAAAAAAVQPGASVISMTGRAKDGQRAHVLVILEQGPRALPSPATTKVTGEPKKMLDTGEAVA